MKDADYAKLLHVKLHEAGIRFSGVGQNGIVYDVDGKTEIQNRQEIRVLAADIHDPLEKIRGKPIRELTARELALLLEEVCDRAGISVDGVIRD